MKNILIVIACTTLCISTGFSQTNENKPILPENIKFNLGTSKLITDNVCDCNSSKEDVTVQVKVTDEMFNYDLIQVNSRHIMDSKGSKGSSSVRVELGKSQFKNLYSAGSNISFELNYESYCLDYDEEIEWNQYIIEVLGANITSYNEVWSQYDAAYIKVPVYGEYDYLTRSDAFKFIQNQEEVKERQRQREEEARQEKQKERRRTIITYSAIGAVAIIVIAYLYL